MWELPDGRGIHVSARRHQLGGVAFVFEDLTESMELRRARAKAVEVRRATVDMLAEGVVVFGPDGQTRIANPAFAEIWSVEIALDANTMHVSDLATRCEEHVEPSADHEDLGVWGRIRVAAASGGGRADWRGRVVLKGGRVLRARIAPMPDGSTLAAFLDITDGERIAAALRGRADALEASDKMRDALLDQLSHRLRTPLNTVFGFAEILERGRAGALTERQRVYVESVRRAAELMRESIEGLTDLIIGDVARVPRPSAAVAVAPILRSAVGLLERRASEKGVALSLEEPKDAAVQGDPALIRQLIYAFLSDAIDHAEADEALGIGLMLDEESVRIWRTGDRRFGESACRAARRAGATLDAGDDERAFCLLPLAAEETRAPRL